ncbi:uncharacterized protein BXZ73DRAFT_101404 [Epithele typhae]|uniref:uncharacterized protein n=1 Tax=Epithele typhae TaxID=378194 RepID=UPI002007721A|nr:uncharacterized protein BXZ73DRAFT_101404 [Epithele typhae]KAH9932029.1 hypothetical protein BXZ73DRAFT_101404 [Epithele typhae]
MKTPSTSLSPPPIRPKAKVNSSATIQTRKVGGIVTVSPSVRNSPALPRPTSPFKPPSRVGNATPVNGAAVKARLTPRPNGNTATSPLSETRQRALTAGIPGSSNFSRQRRISTSSAQLLGSASARSSPSRPPASLPDENTPASNVGGVRVKAKISRVADPSSNKSPPLPASPHLTNRPARVPSISNLSLSPPITPSTSAGHSPSSAGAFSPIIPAPRFGSTRETKHQSFQPIAQAFQRFSPNDDSAVNYGITHNKFAAKVDPLQIPLPPLSPPTSTLSFSSRSSASLSSHDTRDSAASRSTAPTLHSTMNGKGHARTGSHASQPRSSLDGLGMRSDPMSREVSINSEQYSDENDEDDSFSDDHVVVDEERKMKAEAKSNRKIADLEITNRSLLAINSTLEAAKHRQAKEIRELRRKLRESRLILPPPAYRAVKSSLTYDDTAEDEDEDDDEDEDEVINQGIVEGKADEAYRRVKLMIDGLLDSGRRALESKPEDFVGTGISGAKVLTEEEVRDWRGDDSMLDIDADTISLHSSRPLTPSRIAVPNDDGGLGSEDEVEVSLFEPDIPPLDPLPPITVTSPH